MAKNDPKEKRVFRRVAKSWVAEIKRDGTLIPIEIINMSGQGLGFRIGTDLIDHERLAIQLEFEDGHEPLHLTGEVIWKRPAERDQFEVGIKLDLNSWVKMSQILGAD